MKTERQEAAEAPNAGNQFESPQHAVIIQQVLRQLGQPEGRVQVHSLWVNRYRVNIVKGLEIGSALIAHSFFLVTDKDGTILAATPRITKQY